MRRWAALLVSVAMGIGLVLTPGLAAASTDDPVPIPGGIETDLPPPNGPIIHVFLLLAVLAVLASRLGQHGHGQGDGEAAPAGDADTPPLETSAHGAGGDEPSRR